MPAFAGDEGIHAFACGQFQMVPCPARHDADLLTQDWTPRQNNRRVANGLLQPLGQFGEGDGGPGFKSEELSFLEEKGAKFFEAKGGAELRVVAETGMRVQGQVRAVNRQVMIEEQAEQFMPLARPR